MHYSPFPPDRYKLIGTRFDPVDACNSTEHPAACWNLIWLSLPDVDKVPDSGTDWWQHFKLPVGAMTAILSDACEDQLLRSKLVMPPKTFANWFAREDASIFDTYKLLGADLWVQTVLRRAHESHVHRESLAPRRAGNVIVVKFGQRA
jgi:hypothetical protein